MTILITSKRFDEVGNVTSDLTFRYEDHVVGEESWTNLLENHAELGHGLYIGDHTHLVWGEDGASVIAFAEKKEV